MDMEKVVKGLEQFKSDFKPFCGNIADWKRVDDAIALLKEHDNEKKRIMKVILDVLHEGLSIDTVADQDWVYEQIRHKIEDT